MKLFHPILDGKLPESYDPQFAFVNEDELSATHNGYDAVEVNDSPFAVDDSTYRVIDEYTVDLGLFDAFELLRFTKNTIYQMASYKTGLDVQNISLAFSTYDTKPDDLGLSDSTRLIATILEVVT